MNNKAKSILRASPSIGIIFNIKIDKSTFPPRIVKSPNEDTTVTIPIMSGTNEAKTVPKAKSKTIIAIGNPIASAVIKSRWLAALISLEIAEAPVKVIQASSPITSRLSVTTSDILSVSFPKWRGA